MQPTDTTRSTETTDTLVREMVRKRHQRRRNLVVSLVATVVVIAAGLIGAGLVRANQSDAGEAPSRVPAGVTADKSALVFADGPVRVDIYLDYLCPSCRVTERALAADLDTLQEKGKVTLVYHPVTYLDGYSSPRGYSTRAASAAACAADEGKFERYSAVLFDKQPPERGPGLSEAQLVSAGRDAGITGAAFATCVRDRTYTPWVRYVTDASAADKVSLTPTVMVDGRRLDVTGSDPARTLTRAVAEAAR